MAAVAEFSLIRRRYRDALGASLTPAFASYMHCGEHGEHGASLGYRRAADDRLFLEAYLDEPVELAVSREFGKPVARERIFEIGNFAADNAMAMVELWGSAANDLAGHGEVAVATLTAPLRRMFARINMPIRLLAPARAERLGEDTLNEWGSYYDLEPWVCAGCIWEGQKALNGFLQRRRRVAAA